MSFFGSFFGGDQANYLKNANKQANGALASGYDTAQGDYSAAGAGFDPYAAAGAKANQFYNDAIGLDGQPAQEAANATITGNPLFTGALNMQNGNTQAYMNARGAGSGGAFVQAAQNNLFSNYGNWLDRYKDAGTQGLQAAQAKGNVLMGQGDNAYGYGATKAGNAINYGNARAQNANTGINNVLGALSVGIGGYNAFRGTPTATPYASNGTYNLNNLAGGSGYARSR